MEWIQRGDDTVHFNSDERELDKQSVAAAARQGEESYPEEQPLVRDDAPCGVRTYGLCTSCANRDTCLNQMVEGGVWRCPDYA